MSGGNIALIEEGDIITIDITKKQLMSKYLHKNLPTPKKMETA
jgi:dihydroxyacid dehydratase/phosphogluconate dehydratase